MLKWFRKYNKWMLVFFGVLLMVVFLVEGTLTGLMPQREDEIIGRIDGEKIRYRDQSMANRDLEILQRTMPMLTLLAPSDPVVWLLMVKGAQQAGIDASNSQVATLLSMANPSGAATLEEMAKNAGVSTDDLTRSIRHWLMVQQYIELTTGLAHLSVDQKLQALQQGMQYMQMGINNMQMVTEPARGNPRISRPLMQRFLQDQQATVTMQAVAIRPERELANVPKPSIAAIEAVYNKYKDEFPGNSKDYGLGYKLPDRVKLEYLTIPFDSARKTIKIEESELLAYYDAHPDEFTPEATGATPTTPAPAQTPKPYLEVRPAILAQLTDDAAYKLATRIANTAQTQFAQNTRSLDQADGYRKIVASWTPVRLADLSKELEGRFGVTIEIRQPESWLTLTEVQSLPGLGTSSLPMGQQRPLPAASYISGVRELKPDDKHPATNLGLQVYIPSQTVIDRDGSLHIFRVTDAQPAHAPSLDDIRPQVALDAERIEAYKINLTKVQEWKAKLDQPLAAAARELNTNIIGPASFNRRDSFGGTTQVPVIPGIGRSEAFVDGVFNLALKNQADLNTTDVGNKDDQSKNEPAAVIAVDDKLTVYLVRVIKFEPMTKRDFDQQLSMPFNRMWLNMAMMRGLEDEVFSVDNLSKRIGFKWERPRETEEETAAKDKDAAADAEADTAKDKSASSDTKKSDADNSN